MKYPDKESEGRLSKGEEDGEAKKVPSSTHRSSPTLGLAPQPGHACPWEAPQVPAPLGALEQGWDGTGGL